MSFAWALVAWATVAVTLCLAPSAVALLLATMADAGAPAPEATAAALLEDTGALAATAGAPPGAVAGALLAATAGVLPVATAGVPPGGSDLLLPGARRGGVLGRLPGARPALAAAHRARGEAAALPGTAAPAAPEQAASVDAEMRARPRARPPAPGSRRLHGTRRPSGWTGGMSEPLRCEDARARRLPGSTANIVKLQQSESASARNGGRGDVGKSRSL